MTQSVTDTIRGLLAEHARLGVDVASLSDTADLYGAGMTSHASVTVMLACEDEWDLEVVLGRALLERKTTIALAESCTGGLVAGLLTRVPGISAVFGQGHVVYSDDAKERLLGVPRALLAAHGAVSREVAEAMALGAARAAEADLAVAVTGIAGPGGGTAQKPVGLVCFATVLAGEVRSVERRFPPVDRDAIRRWSARTALFLAWKRLFDAGRARPSVD